MTDRALFRLQRLSALLLAPLVLVHLGLILWAIRDGLSASEILDRTSGSTPWALFYGAFVVAAAIHAPIGVRNVLRELTPIPRIVIDGFCAAMGFALLMMGLRAVWLVTL